MSKNLPIIKFKEIVQWECPRCEELNIEDFGDPKDYTGYSSLEQEGMVECPNCETRFHFNEDCTETILVEPFPENGERVETPYYEFLRLKEG